MASAVPGVSTVFAPSRLPLAGPDGAGATGPWTSTSIGSGGTSASSPVGLPPTIRRGASAEAMMRTPDFAVTAAYSVAMSAEVQPQPSPPASNRSRAPAPGIVPIVTPPALDEPHLPAIEHDVAALAQGRERQAVRGLRFEITGQRHDRPRRAIAECPERGDELFVVATVATEREHEIGLCGVELRAQAAECGECIWRGAARVCDDADDETFIRPSERVIARRPTMTEILVGEGRDVERAAAPWLLRILRGMEHRRQVRARVRHTTVLGFVTARRERCDYSESCPPARFHASMTFGDSE